MLRNGGRRFGEGMAQDSRIQRLTDDLAIGFLIVWLLAPAPMAVAETATIQAVTPDGTQSPSQPTPEEDLLNLQD
jgi:hypothetical protein